jgi:hypothetical protein
MITAQQLFDRIREALPWSIPIKLMLSALLGVLGGAGLLGYLSEYATYNYAIHYGFRPPLEGIPYLRPAVAFGSLFLLLSGGLVFLSIAFILRSIVFYFDAVPRIAALTRRLLGGDPSRQERRLGYLLTSIRGRPLWQHLAFSLAFAIIFTGLMATIEVVFHDGGQSLLNARFVVIVTVYTFTSAFAALRPHTIWWMAICATAVYFVVCVYLLFTPTKYSEFLRLLGYGGGISVRIELRDDNCRNKLDAEVQQLMLRTTEAVILYDSSRGSFSEIPRDQVHRIVHDNGGLRRLPYLLPEKVQH